MVDYVAHRNTQMAFVIDALAIADQQYLGGLVVYLENIGYFIGYGPVANEIEVVEINGFWLFGSFEAAFYQGAGGATRTVLKDQLGTGSGFFFNLVQLSLCL
jgi:hypothetical protein